MPIGDSMGDTFLSLRRCFLEPPQEILTAARLLREAVDAHLVGQKHRAEALISAADVPAIAKWTDSVWGRRNQQIHRFRPVPSCPPTLPIEMRPQPRMPTEDTLLRVKQRDGFHCRFCGIPVIDSPVRRRVRAAYPGVLRWGRKNVDQHAAFQCMWLQYDHVLPNSREGEQSCTFSKCSRRPL